jgi:hypothetical protein
VERSLIVYTCTRTTWTGEPYNIDSCMLRTASIASSLPLSVSNVISHRFVPNLCANVTKVVARSPLFPLFSFLDSTTLPKVLKTVRTVSSLTADESPEILSVCPGMNSYSQLKLYEIVPRLAQVASTSATTKRLFSLTDTSFRLTSSSAVWVGGRYLSWSRPHPYAKLSSQSSL